MYFPFLYFIFTLNIQVLFYLRVYGLRLLHLQVVTYFTSELQAKLVKINQKMILIFIILMISLWLIGIGSDISQLHIQMVSNELYSYLSKISPNFSFFPSKPSYFQIFQVLSLLIKTQILINYKVINFCLLLS